MAAASASAELQLDPYDYAEVRRIASGLGVAEPIAVILVRRGHRTTEDARQFLEARERHDPFDFDGMEAVCEKVLSAVRDGRRITIHGDYDVDGVSATAILVGALRELGADCDWLIPDRLSEGYGLSEASVAAARSRGTRLLVTVDCGIGSAAEVELARAAGIEVVVSDHHEPPAHLPDCPILHPSVSGYPFRDLCGTGVAHKLATALRIAAGRGAGAESADLDLVALATVADMVPLLGENRRLVREGLRALRAGSRPGLRALMEVARVDRQSVDEGALGFRLGPRINAAGRLYRADAGVELMLTADPHRAEAIAAELDRANAERRATEREVADDAQRLCAELAAGDAVPAALVVAGRGWHPGVVGIAASRIAERHLRPAVLISLEGERGRGSARSVPGFDLISALDACAEHLVRHGGHRAAAGLELRASELEAFREAFVEHAESRLGAVPPVRTERVDALVGVGREGIGLELAAQLERLRPFGVGNPDPRLLVPAGRLSAVRPLGEEGRHSSFHLESGNGRAMGVAFGMNGAVSSREGEALDLSVELEIDRWNGAEQPRVILRELHPRDDGEAAICAGACPAPAEEWWERFEAARDSGGESAGTVEDLPASSRELVDRRGGAAVAALAELVSAGEPVLAVCADASRRRALAAAACDPRRFGSPAPRVACSRCGSESLDAALGALEPGSFGEADAPDASQAAAGLALVDWATLTRRPRAAARFHHVFVVDPPPSPALERLAGVPRSDPRGGVAFAPGYLHLAWGPAEVEFALRCHQSEWELRSAVAEVWRGLAGRERAGGEELAALLRGDGPHPRSPEVAGRCVAVLCELGLCEWRPVGAVPALGVVSSNPSDLERSAAYRACAARHQETIRYLRNRAQEA